MPLKKEKKVQPYLHKYKIFFLEDCKKKKKKNRSHYRFIKVNIKKFDRFKKKNHCLIITILQEKNLINLSRE